VELVQWVNKAGGVAKAAKLLKEKKRTVESWVRYERPPSFDAALNIVLKSKGDVDFNGIYQPIAKRRASQDVRVANCQFQRGNK